MSDAGCPGCEYVIALRRWSNQLRDGAPPGTAGPRPAPREHERPYPLATHACTSCGADAFVQCVECGDWRCDRHWCGGQWCAPDDRLRRCAVAVGRGEACVGSSASVATARKFVTQYPPIGT